jgi:hypothetical protein
MLAVRHRIRRLGDPVIFISTGAKLESHLAMCPTSQAAPLSGCAVSWPSSLAARSLAATPRARCRVKRYLEQNVPDAPWSTVYGKPSRVAHPNSQPGLKAIEMWWVNILIPALLILGVYCFLVVVGFRTRLLTRKTNRTVESMYDNYADSPRKQHKYARDHGGTWKDDDGLDADVAEIMRRRT